MIKRIKIKGGPEKMVLTGFIVSTDFIHKVKPLYNKRAMSSKWARIITDWCLEYYDEFHKAPREAIRDIYDCERAKLTPEDADLVKKHLASLSDEFERADLFNYEYAVKQAQFFFKERSLQKLNQQIEELVAKGEVDKASELLQQYSVPSIQNEQISDNILTDKAILKRAFESSVTPLIQFTGAFGAFMNPLFTRKSFITIMGPEKRGKTWWLNEIAMQALKCRCKVGYINCGDMDNEEQSVRFSIRIAGRNSQQEYCGWFPVPVLDCYKNQMDTCVLARRKCSCGVVMETTEGKVLLPPEEAPKEYSACSECKNDPNFQGALWTKKIHVDKPLTWKQALAINRKFEKNVGTKNRFKMESFPNGTLTPKMLESRIERWIHEDGFLPDVLVVDYADIMDAGAEGDFRQGENKKWKAIRSLCQKYNILLVTATQSDAESYSAVVIKEKNFSEDKRKYSHVTGVVTLNQNEEEAEKGIMRIGKMMVRHGQKTSRVITVLQSLRQGRPNIGSYHTTK